MGNCLGRKASTLDESFIFVQIDNEDHPTFTESSQENLLLSLDQFTKHSYQTLRSFINELYHQPQQSICIHQQKNTILIEHKTKEYSIETLIANVTYNLTQICFNQTHHNEIFGFVSKRNSNTLEQILVDRSKYNSTKTLNIRSTKFYLVQSIDKWPEDIQIHYRNRSRLWPFNIEHLFDKTCFIRYKTNQNQTYTYTAIEHQLILCMSDEQKSLAVTLWNYLNSKTDGRLSYRIFKHTFFYFLENVSMLMNFSRLKSDFIEFFLGRLDRQQCPHYFDSNRNLYHDQMKTITSKLRMIDSESRSISISSNYFSKLTYLIEFLRHFQLSRTVLTENILSTHELVSQQIELNYQLELDQLDRYQEQNIEIIRNYLPFIRQYEPSLIVHTYWSLFIQYFNSLFDDVFYFENLTM